MSAPAGEGPPDRLPALLLLVGLARLAAVALALGPLWDTAWMSHLVQDIRTWEGFFAQARAGGVPYVDFSKEYPVGAGVLYWLMSALVVPGDLRQTVRVHALVMAAIDLVNVGLAYRLLRDRAPRRAFALALLLALNPTAVVLGPVRFESAVVTFVLVGCALHRRERPLLAVLAWSLGCWLKWFPAFFIAAQEYRALLLGGKRWRWLLAGGVFLAVAAAVNGPFLLAAGARHGSFEAFLAPYRFHVQRPLYWDTLLGVGQLWLGALPWERQASLWTLGLVLLALLVRPRLALEPKGVLMCLAAIVFNRIYSTQFHLWFHPFLLLAAASEPPRRFRALLALFVSLDLVNVLVFPFSFSRTLQEIPGFFPLAARVSPGPWTAVFSAAIVARTALVLALAVFLLRSAPPDPPARLRRLDR